MKDLYIIIPINTFSEEVKGLLDKAINSVPNDLLITLSTTLDLNDKISKYSETIKGKRITVVHNENNISDFCTLINNAINKEYTWFSILEYDDTYTNIWFNNIKKYIDNMDDISVFLPLTDLIDFTNNKFVGFSNEAPWASSFSNEIGYIDYESLQNYFSFNLTGGVFNTADWDEVNGLKSSIKLSFWYEFLLRLTKNGKKVYVIPKSGYIHYVGRPNSLMEQYSNEIDEEESKFWINTAKKECEFLEDRNIEYKKK